MTVPSQTKGKSGHERPVGLLPGGREGAAGPTVAYPLAPLSGVPEAGVMEDLELDSPTVKSCFLPWLSWDLGLAT